MNEPKDRERHYTLGEWLAIWLDDFAPAQLKESTVSIYRDAYRRFFAAYPNMEETKLQDLTTLEFERLQNKLASKYAKSTLNHMKVLFNHAYEAAIKGKLCENNPIAEAHLPTKATTKVVTGLSKEEQFAFEGSMSILSPMDEFVLRMYLMTGLRRDELRLLQWRDWDKKRNLLWIRDSKTENGIRRVPLVPEVIAILYILSRRSACKLGDCIISNHDGDPVSKGHIRYICNKVAKAANIRHVTPHMLRHTFATRMIEAGADVKSVSMILGHASVVFTLQRYVEPDYNHLQNQMMLISQGARGGGKA